MKGTILVILSLLTMSPIYVQAQADTTQAEESALLDIKEFPTPRFGMQGIRDSIDRRAIRRCTSPEEPVRHVTVMFQVNERGRVENVLPVNTGTIGECEEEVIRIMEKQRFKPGRDSHGNKITVTMMLDLTFRRG